MQYMLLIYGQEADWAALTESQRQAVMEEHAAFGKLAEERGMMVGGDELHPSLQARTIRLRDGKVQTTDGPFAETREQLGGYYILECKSLDEAAEMAAKLPEARTGSIEVRPLVDHSS